MEVQMKWTTLMSGVAITAAVFAVQACDDDPASPSPDGSASVAVYLTDAPGDVERAWVEILAVTFRADGETVTFVPEAIELIEVTQLLDNTRLLVDEQELDPATLSELRLVIGDAALEAKSGDVYVLGDPELPGGLTATGILQCPSCQQSGIKVKVSGDQMELDEGDSAFLLDFDVAQTFGHRAGNSGVWVMNPVVHATLVVDEDGNGVANEVAGALADIQGTVVLGSPGEGPVVIPQCPAGTNRSIEDFVPTAAAQTLVDGDGQPIVKAAIVHTNGEFSFAGMDADTYALGFIAEFDYGTDILAFEATTDPAEAAVGDTPVTGVVYTIIGATCSPTS
jgi:hypothetical protein